MIQSHPQGTLLMVRVQPGSRKQGVLGRHDNRLKVAVHAPPEKGKANQELIEVLAEFFDLKRSQIQLITGETSSQKSLLILNTRPDMLAAKLALCT